STAHEHHHREEPAHRAAVSDEAASLGPTGSPVLTLGSHRAVTSGYDGIVKPEGTTQPSTVDTTGCAADAAGSPGDELSEIALDFDADGSRRYVIEGELARGGLGRVLLAHDRRLDRTVAIKEILLETPGARRRFLREAMLTARLEHP